MKLLCAGKSEGVVKVKNLFQYMAQHVEKIHQLLFFAASKPSKFLIGLALVRIVFQNFRFKACFTVQKGMV